MPGPKSTPERCGRKSRSNFQVRSQVWQDILGTQSDEPRRLHPIPPKTEGRGRPSLSIALRVPRTPDRVPRIPAHNSETPAHAPGVPVRNPRIPVRAPGSPTRALGSPTRALGSPTRAPGSADHAPRVPAKIPGIRPSSWESGQIPKIPAQNSSPITCSACSMRCYPLGNPIRGSGLRQRGPIHDRGFRSSTHGYSWASPPG